MDEAAHTDGTSNKSVHSRLPDATGGVPEKSEPVPARARQDMQTHAQTTAQLLI